MQVPHEDTSNIKFTIQRLQRDHADEMVGVRIFIS